MLPEVTKLGGQRFTHSQLPGIHGPCCSILAQASFCFRGQSRGEHKPRSSHTALLVFFKFDDPSTIIIPYHPGDLQQPSSSNLSSEASFVPRSLPGHCHGAPPRVPRPLGFVLRPQCPECRAAVFHAGQWRNQITQLTGSKECHEDLGQSTMAAEESQICSMCLS